MAGGKIPAYKTQLIAPRVARILVFMNQQKFKTDVLQWSHGKEGKYQVCGDTTRNLPAGGYSCDFDNCGNPLFTRRKLSTDNLIQASQGLASEVLHEVDRFWSLESCFRKYGFLHRRGYLFYGKQGGGKSSLIHQIVSDVVAAGNVAFFCSKPYYFIKCLTQFRKVEPTRPLVCVFEDIESIIEDWGDNLLLQWLDGNHQVDRAISLASTNYPEKLDRRIIARPRRFDRIIRIDAPCSQLREEFLSQKLPQQTSEDRLHWVTKTEGFTFAALTELIIGVFCFQDNFDLVVERLRDLDGHEPSSLEFANDG